MPLGKLPAYRKALARYNHRMKGEKRERWMDICSQVANEQDPDKVLELVKKLNEMLEEKEKRLGILPKKESGIQLRCDAPILLLSFYKGQARLPPGLSC
jgi:hypothetical protein